MEELGGWLEVRGRRSSWGEVQARPQGRPQTIHAIDTYNTFYIVAYFFLSSLAVLFLRRGDNYAAL